MIVGNLSRFSSANNHLIGEAAGVYVAASTWPLWPQMRGLGRALPRRSSKRNATSRTRPTAAIASRRSRYQTFVLDFLMLAGLAARARGEDFSPVYWRRLEVMIDFLASMTNVAGALPMIGDARRRLRREARVRAGLLAARLADRHRRGAVRAAGPRGQGRRARRQDRHLVRRGGGARASRSSSSAAAPGSGRSMQFTESGYYLHGHGASTRRTRCGCWWMRARSDI